MSPHRYEIHGSADIQPSIPSNNRKVCITLRASRILLWKGGCSMTRPWGLLLVAADLLIGLGTMCKAQEQASKVPAVETGYLHSFDGTRLYYEKVGNGS